MVARYENGAPVVLPSSCLGHSDGRACDVRRHSTRARKCGPEQELTVLRCRTHGVAFTVYPVGWTPYDRAPLVAAASQETVFTPALQVAEASSLSAASGHRRSLVRVIVRAAAWLGLTGTGHEQVAAALDMDLAPHLARRGEYARATTWHRRAGLVAEAHRVVPAERQVERLLVAGWRGGCCGRPWRVDPQTGALAARV